MPKFKHYSPQLSRKVVRRLYHQAKAERIPMTVLANQIIEKALDKKEQINTQAAAASHYKTEPM